MRYMLFWLSEKAAQYTESHSPFEVSVSHLYCTANEVLSDLKNIYEDFDKLRNCCCIYDELIQKQQKFSDFFIEFHHLFTCLRYDEPQCINNLWDKITAYLQSALTSQLI